MSILNCVQGKVSGKIFAELEERYDEILREVGGDTARADAELVRRVELDEATVKKSRILNALKTTDVLKEAKEKLAVDQAAWNERGKFSQGLGKLLRQRPALHKSYREVALHRADKLGDGYFEDAVAKMPAFRQIVVDQPFDREVSAIILRGLVDGPDVTTDNLLRQAIVEYRKFLQWEAKAFTQRGILIGQMGDRYVPVMHNPDSVSKMGEDAWLDWIMERSDPQYVYDLRNYTTGVSDARLREIYRQAYDTMENGAAAEARRQLERGVTGPRREGHTDLFARKQNYKIFHPRTGQDYVDVVEMNHGLENGLNMLTEHIKVSSRDMGIADVLGPRPQTLHNRLRLEAQARDADAVQLQIIDGEFNTLMNQWTGSSDSVILKGVLNMQKLQSMSLLGGAGIAAIADQAFVGNTKRLFRMLDADGRMGAWFDTLSKADALDAIHTVEFMNRNSLNRFDAGAGSLLERGPEQWLTRGKNVVHSLSGLTWMTEKAGDQMSMITFGYLGQSIRRGASWDDMASMHPMFSRAGLNKADWDALVQRGVTNEGGFLMVDNLPVDMAQTAVKLRALNSAMRQFATNAPDLSMRAFSSGRMFGPRARGDMVHVAASSVAQFKSFPVMVWRNHMIPSLNRIAQEGMMSQAGWMFGVTMMEALMLGAMVVQLKQIAAGKPMLDSSEVNFWMKAGLQGGFFGLVGDILLKDPNQWGRNLIGELAGPVPGTVNDAGIWLTQSAWDMLDGDPETDVDTAQMMRIIRAVTPGSTLWYIRATMDRMVWDNLNIMLDEEYYETMSRQRDRQISEHGQLGWWAPGMSPNVGGQ